MSRLTAIQSAALWQAHDEWRPCPAIGRTIRALRRRGLVRERIIYREVQEFGAAETADRQYLDGWSREWRITQAGRALLEKLGEESGR